MIKLKDKYDKLIESSVSSVEVSHLRFLNVRSKRGLTAAIAVSGGKNILALWSSKDNLNNNVVVNELNSFRISIGSEHLSTISLENCDSAFQYIDVFSAIGTGVIIIIASAHNIYRYELSQTLDVKLSVDVHNMVDTFCSSACQSILLDHKGELSAFFQDDYSVIIRSEVLRRLISIRPIDHLRSQYAAAVSSSGAAVTVIAAGFTSMKENRLIILCFECGVILGYDIYSGMLMISFGTLSSISSSLASSHSPCLLLVEDGQSDHPQRSSLRNFYVIIAYRDGKIKVFEIFRKSSSDANDEGCDFEHRESLSFDLTRELRYQPSSTHAGQDNLPLAMHFIPPSLQFTRSAAMFAKSPKGFLTIQHAHLCVASAGSIVILRLWPPEVIKYVPMSSMQHAESVRSASIGVYTPAPQVDSTAHSKRWVYDDDEDDEDNKSSAFLEIHTIFSFSDRSVTTFRVPLFSTAEKVISAKDKSGRQDTLVSAAVLQPHQQTMDSTVKRTAMDSVYVDESVPLSFFMPPKYADSASGNRSKKLDDDGQQPETEAIKYMLSAKMKPLDTPLAMKGATPYPARFDWETPLKDKNGRHIDQPVTFHTKIKSSGYGQVSHDPLVRKKKQLQQQKQSAVTNKMRSLSAPRLRLDSAKEKNKMVQYPVNCSLIMHHQPRDDFPPGGKPPGSNQLPAIFNVCYSADGQQLALASADVALLSIKLPVRVNAREVSAYLGHNNRIQSVCFSHQKYPSSTSTSTATSPHPLLLSASADGSARLWQHGRMEYPLLLFSHHQCNPGSYSGTDSSLAVKSSLNGTNVRNKPYATPVNSANFFFADKFIVLSIKSAVLMYTYDLTWSQQFNDLKSLLSAAPSVANPSSAGRYKLVQEWNSHTVTAVSCVNAVQSPIILAATSDKKLLVLDAAVGMVAREIPSPHDRSIHCIALPCPSVHIPLLLDAYNMFATSAMDNAITLWDIRAPQSVARYTSHVNRREAVQAAVSPCLRYIATGSEDRTARVVDVRTGREVARIAGQHGDVVSSVAFHPLSAQLATASYDGTVKFYRDGAG